MCVQLLYQMCKLQCMNLLVTAEWKQVTDAEPLDTAV